MSYSFKKLLVVALKSEWSFLKQELRMKKISESPLLFSLLDRSDLGLLQIGVGPKNASEHFRHFLNVGRCDSVLHFGCCGALVPDYKVGDLVIPYEIQNDQSRPVSLSSERLSELINFLSTTNLRYHRSRLFTSHKLIAAKEEKIASSYKYDCQAVDMESYEIAKICKENNVAYISAKSIFDEISDEDIGTLEEPHDGSGNLSLSGLSKNILRSPKLILKLPHLKRRIDLGNKNLKNVVHWYLEKKK